jgi:hypothetical protein
VCGDGGCVYLPVVGWSHCKKERKEKKKKKRKIKKEIKLVFWETNTNKTIDKIWERKGDSRDRNKEEPRRRKEWADVNV